MKLRSLLHRHWTKRLPELPVPEDEIDADEPAEERLERLLTPTEAELIRRRHRL